MTKKDKVIAFIKEGGKVGRRFGEIQRFIVEDLHGYDYDEMSIKYDWKSNSYKPARKYRGYWCTYLLGPSRYYGIKLGFGILPNRCSKVNRRWVHNDYVK